MPTRYSHSVRTSASVEAVWEALQQPDVWASVAGVDDTSNHRNLNGRLSGFDFSTSIAGMTYRGSARVSQAVPGRSMTLSIRSNEVIGTIQVAFDDTDEGTDLDVSMQISPNGLVGAMVFPAVSSALRTGFPESVERLAASLD